MSAIYGMINKKGEPLDTALTERIQQAIGNNAHAETGTWLVENVLLGHGNLQISHRQQHDPQPLADNNLVITGDIRIDNRQALFPVLGIVRELHDTYPDSRLILEAYKKWGADCTNHLEGEFAFAIWNNQSKKLFCAVDHVGFRSLFYYDTPDVFVFCSEMKGILAVKQTPNIFNEEIIVEYFFRQSDQQKTHNAEIFALCGGNRLFVERGKMSIERYWTLQPSDKYRFTKDEEWAQCLRELLFEAVGNRMDTPLPVGITLSGGLDSSTVACIASSILKKQNKQLFAFSSVLPEGHTGIERDERYYIELLGKELGNIDQTYIHAPEKGPFTDLEKVFEIEESLPTVFHYIDYAIFDAVRAKGVGVLLSGLGGDNFVSFKGNAAIYRLLGQNEWATSGKLLSQVHKYESRSYWSVIKTELIAHTAVYKKFYSFRDRNRINWQNYTPLNDAFLKKYTRKPDIADRSMDLQASIDQVNSGYIGRMLSLCAYRSNTSGFEMGLPLFDRKVIEFMSSVPISQFRTGGSRRSIVRRAMEGLIPQEIQNRTDKLPYSPGYHSRITNSIGQLEMIIQSGGTEKWEYISKNKIIDNIGAIRPQSGFTPGKDISGIRIAQSVICCSFIDWLKKNKYGFEK